MKPLFITAGILLLIGLMLFGGAYFINGGFSDEKVFNTQTVTVEEDISSIFIDADTTDIAILPATDETCTVRLYEKKKLPHTVSVENGTLTVTKAEKKWYDYINFFNFSTPKITVYLPAVEYQRLSIKGSTGDITVSKDLLFESMDLRLSTGDVEISASAANMIKVQASTGDIMLKGVRAGNIDITISTGDTTLNEVECGGDIRIKSTTGDININNTDCTGDIKAKNSTGKSTMVNVRCEDLISEASTGSLRMTNVIASEKFTLERDTGEIHFDRCDASEIFAETDTGSVKGTLLTDKIFITKTDTGTINVPESTQGGKCKITTDTGNITISIIQ
ncbi:MAG: DUF4097 family beta strand repeat protein [Clostridia bacterium]|nr:DUF4097 family beta strand repeat protein [Clostridia bacterium]